MRKRRIGALAILLAAGFAFSSPLMAHAKKGKGGGGGGESMKGGLPALEDRVDADEALIAALGHSSWAVVGADGTLARNSGSALSVSVIHTVTGIYEVDFSTDVSHCAYVATLGDVGTGTPLPGEVTVAGATNLDGVTVQTYDNTGAAADASFHLLVSCP